MTKFVYMSDLHLEFCPLPKADPNFEGDYLILAGDITVLGILQPKMNDAQSRKARDRALTFFDIARENFKQIFYVTGNHESYKFNIDHEAEYIEKYLPGIVHLQNKSVELENDIVIMGGTLWTDFNQNDPLAHHIVSSNMNDFRIIYNKDNIWTTYDAYGEHVVTRNFLNRECEKYKDKKIIVATHHAPSFKGLNPDHSRSGYMNYGYFSDLEKFIADRPQIKYWIYGHTHIQKKYQLTSDTWILSNARGYEGYEPIAKDFLLSRNFEL